MTCKQTADLVDEWMATGSAPEREARAASEHVNACPYCLKRFGALMTLVEFDAGLAVAEEKPGLSDAVMARIAREGHARRSPTFRTAMALAASLIVLLGGTVAIGRKAAVDRETVVIRFELAAPDAYSVALAGDFTGWSTDGFGLKRKRADGPWEITVRLRRAGSYAYSFVVDGELWIPDPAAPIRADDGFGGQNSVINL
ncbi:MAG: isoamylase early set domain-containing protein [Spirochaetes bacterium]|nr:isoamylase early set domain-containing protein [Spirochaetota bacterium]